MSETARQLLEKQLEELGSIYNAGVRSQGFREWRQNTLTCIQRIWSSEPAKSERFRRIPFSPPMGRPDDRAVREYFERGCGEAGSFLKGLIAEIASGGLPDGGAGLSPLAAASQSPGAVDDFFPTVDLPGGGKAAGPARTAAPPKPRLKDLLGFTDAPAHAEAPGESAPATHPAAAAGAPRLPETPAPAPAAPSPEPAAHSGAGPQLLPGLESHGFFAPPATTPHEASMPGVPGSQPGASAPPAALPRIVVTGPEPAAAAPQVLPPGHSPPGGTGPGTLDSPAAPTAEPGAGRHPGDMERVAEELLRASSALSSLPRRMVQDRRASPREIRSPIPLAVASLALEVEALGVPEGHRARVRAVMLDLSRRLDEPTLTWDTLREAMTFVMEFPALGRRMVPLLLHYLDRAA